MPLIVKLPGQTEGRIQDTPAETIDILPTVVDGLGGSLPWAVDGRSLLSDSGPPRQVKTALREVDAGGTILRFEYPLDQLSLLPTVERKVAAPHRARALAALSDDARAESLIGRRMGLRPGRE